MEARIKVDELLKSAVEHRFGRQEAFSTDIVRRALDELVSLYRENFRSPKALVAMLHEYISKLKENPYQAKNIAPTFLTQSLTDMPIQSSNHMPAVAPASEADQLPIGSLPMTFQSSAPMAHKSLPVQTLDPSELERKQAKAQELRESFQSLKAEKLRSRSDKVQAVKERKMDQSRKLKESIEEKLVKAERLRESRLKSIQTKAKDENAKRDEITFITALNTENKKIEVKQRHQETEARLQELEGERLRKMSEVAAMQEAALERRRLQEQERLAKLAREEERKREAEAKKDEERKQREEQRIANKTEKLKRLEAFKSSKEAVVSQMRRELDERLEKGIRRKDEQLQQVKEKAAAANHNARAVADRVNAIRRTPEKHMQTDEDGDATPDEPSSLGAGPSTPRTAPTGAQAPSLSPPRGLPDNRRGAPSPHLILAPTTSDASDTSPSKRKAEKRRLKRVRQKVHEASEMFMYFPPTELGDVDKISKETICLGLEVAQCAAALPATVEYLLRSSDLLSLRMVEQLSRVVPKCAVLPETAMPVASRLFDLLSTCLEHESANAQTAGVQEDLVDIAGRPFYERKQLRPHANSLASVFGQSDLCGLVTMLDSVLLFKVGNARTAAEESLPIVCIEIAAAILRTLNNICALDLCMVQSVLAAHGLSTECFHLILFWIQYWDKWSPTARGAFAANAAGVSQDQERGLLLDELLRELLVFLGNICLDNPKLAEMARLGSTQGPVMLRRLCLLPPRYFIEPTRQQALLPTLIVLTAHDDVNRLILEEEVSEQMLALFLQRHARRADEPKAGGAHMSLAMRLPERLRDPALFSSASKQAAE
nr:Sentrin-specific protease 3 [Polyrhizophydium stewartii]